MEKIITVTICKPFSKKLTMWIFEWGKVVFKK